MNPKNLNNERELVETISIETGALGKLRSWAEPGWFAILEEFHRMPRQDHETFWAHISCAYKRQNQQSELMTHSVFNEHFK